jgi:hypothetical protein
VELIKLAFYGRHPALQIPCAVCFTLAQMRMNW